MEIKLTEIAKRELKSAFIMHFKGFLPTFFKYRDFGKNPIFLSYKNFVKYYNHIDMFMYYILCDDKSVGQIWLLKKNNRIKLVRIFVLKKYQNKGIATKAILQAEQIFNCPHHWWLDTIKEEHNNCHLYEKLGYKLNGTDKKINKRMTIIEYEKEF